MSKSLQSFDTVQCYECREEFDIEHRWLLQDAVDELGQLKHICVACLADINGKWIEARKVGGK